MTITTYASDVAGLFLSRHYLQHSLPHWRTHGATCPSTTTRFASSRYWSCCHEWCLSRKWFFLTCKQTSQEGISALEHSNFGQWSWELRRRYAHISSQKRGDLSILSTSNYHIYDQVSRQPRSEAIFDTKMVSLVNSRGTWTPAKSRNKDKLKTLTLFSDLSFHLLSPVLVRWTAALAASGVIFCIPD